MADGNIMIEVRTAAQDEMQRLRDQNATLKRDLVYARDGLTKGRTRMREDIARLTDATRWRNVEDEQPRNGQEVLATIFPYRNKINRQMIVHAVYVDALWLCSADREPLHEPTHWMPAPALPDGA